MTKDARKHPSSNPARRRALKQGMALGAATLGAPWVARYAHAQAADLGAYQKARINWRLAEGRDHKRRADPGQLFRGADTLTPEFEALTGIKVRYEKVPPGQIRQKAMLDLSAKTGTSATHAADPMY